MCKDDHSVRARQGNDKDESQNSRRPKTRKASPVLLVSNKVTNDDRTVALYDFANDRARPIRRRMKSNTFVPSCT